MQNDLLMLKVIIDYDQKMPPYFNLIYACGQYGEFSLKNQMPWAKIKEDLSFFYKVTTNTNGDNNKKNVLIYGRNTFESFNSIPLANRHNIVVSTKLLKSELHEEKEKINTVSSLTEALNYADELIKQGRALKIFVIGGVRLLEEARHHPLLEYVYETVVTRVNGYALQADNFMNFKFDNLVSIKQSDTITSDNQFKLVFTKYICKREHQEDAYLNLCRKILTHGKTKPDRTGAGTISSWGESISFDLSKGFPLYTTKRVFWRAVIAELLSFISGKTNIKYLEQQGITIWKGNTSRDYLDKYGFPEYNEGELGPGYAWQWRHCGAEYKPNVQLEIGQGGFDQLQWVIDAIKAVKENPHDPKARRLIVSSWNPIDVPKMSLPCCHWAYQFSVDGDNLNCLVTMRSCDLFLGNPFNIASYALLTHMICHLVGLIPGKLVLNMADTHIYMTHVEAVKKQLTRPPREWPTLEIIGNYNSIDDFTKDSFKFHDYNPRSTIFAPMEV